MYGSIGNGVFVNPLEKPRGSVHVAGTGGLGRGGSFCFRQGKGTPFWSTCVWFGVLDAGDPSPCTPCQRPYRVSKLWFSSQITPRCWSPACMPAAHAGALGGPG